VRFEGSTELAASPAAVYAFITDPAKVVTIIPDVQESKIADGDHFSVKAKAGIGPMRGTLTMSFQVTEKKPGEAATLVGRGQGMQGTVDMAMTISLARTESGTRASWAADAKVGGILASVGGRLIGGVAEKYVREITEALKKQFP
jgi:uncharacterized protein